MNTTTPTPGAIVAWALSVLQWHSLNAAASLIVDENNYRAQSKQVES